jgi:hypothetical protein
MDDGNTYRAQIIQKILDHDAENHQNIKFLVKLGNGDFHEIITYNTLSNIIENQLDQRPIMLMLLGYSKASNHIMALSLPTIQTIKVLHITSLMTRNGSVCARETRLYFSRRNCNHYIDTISLSQHLSSPFLG